jgi:hypothetical protein
VKWSAYVSSYEPLGKLVVSRSYEKEGTKTQVTREVRVHPVLAAILKEWRETGWKRVLGRKPKDDDLIVPSLAFTPRLASNVDNDFAADLAALGLRHRRGHDLRRTFVALAQVDGARRDVLKVITHGVSEADIVDMYTSFPWPTLCEAVSSLRVPMPAAPIDPDSGGGPMGSEAVEAAPQRSASEIGADFESEGAVARVAATSTATRGV